MTGLVGAMVSFMEGGELMGELAGVQVDAKQVERTAEALGAEIAEDERCHVEPPPTNEAIPPTLYLGMDGTGILPNVRPATPRNDAGSLADPAPTDTRAPARGRPFLMGSRR